MVEYDPQSREIREDPYPIYRELRDNHPVLYNEALGFWTCKMWSGNPPQSGSRAAGRGNKTELIATAGTCTRPPGFRSRPRWTR